MYINIYYIFIGGLDLNFREDFAEILVGNFKHDKNGLMIIQYENKYIKN